MDFSTVTSGLQLAEYSQIRIKIYCYIAICGLLWSNWCEYKHTLGVEFGEYALAQYAFAKDYYDIVVEEMGELQ